MGHIILPTGASLDVEDLHGTANLHQLLQDMKNDNYTNNYRISIITAISKLGKHAWSALSYLKEIASRQDNVLLAEAARGAVRRIEAAPASDNTFMGPPAATSRAVHPERQGNRPLLGPMPDMLGSSAARQVGNDVIYPVAKRERNKVTISEIECDSLDEGTKVYCRCHFCEKVALINNNERQYCDKLVGTDRFFCNFCLRNDLYNKVGQHTYILTFRSLIGYYYYCYYAVPKQPAMPMADIQEMTSLHFRVGIQNPIFRYDPETFCWFVDFTKVGKSRRKMPVESVLETVVQLLSCFHLYENIKDCSPHKLYAKYKKGIMQFYHDRTRPKGRILAPTLLSCDIPKHTYEAQRAIPIDVVKNFLPCHLLETNYWRGGRR